MIMNREKENGRQKKKCITQSLPYVIISLLCIAAHSINNVTSSV